MCPPLSKNSLVSDRSKIFYLLKLFFVKLKKKILGCNVTKTMMTSSKPEILAAARKFI